MKNSIIYRWVLFLAVGLFLISHDGYSQEVKFNKQERKEAREMVRYANFHLLDSLLESKRFVLEADYLQNQYGDRIIVTPLLNFIKVNSSDIVLQTGTSIERGFNGVGGVTAEGRVGTYEVIRNLKNLSYYLKFTVLSNLGPYDVSITVNSDNRARATISGLSRGKLIYEGRLVTLENSRVYKGWNSI